MNARVSLLDNFSSMQDEFNSSNNRNNRDIDSVFKKNFGILRDNLEYFNDEYEVLSKEGIMEDFDYLKERILEVKKKHFTINDKEFFKEMEFFKISMCSFFEEKIKNMDNTRIRHSVRKLINKWCEYDIFSLEEDLADCIYNYRVNFEMAHIDNEYCKEDFNKVLKSFEHDLINDLRSGMFSFMAERQEIVSRYINKAYDIVSDYRRIGR